ncbi:negative regulator of P-body association [Myotis yumanensis]|uniref:negative regulator of P-body association n=1 Tax=Myotis yumanensis TaxID=159337 RepID=UPI0038D110B6
MGASNSQGPPESWHPGPIILLGNQPCASRRSTRPPGNTWETKPPKKRCLLAIQWEYLKGTPNGNSTPLPSAPPPAPPGLKSHPPPQGK